MFRRFCAIFLTLGLVTGSAPSDASAFYSTASSTTLDSAFARNALLEGESLFLHPLLKNSAVRLRQGVSKRPIPTSGIGIAGAVWTSWLQRGSLSYEPFLKVLQTVVTQHAKQGKISLSSIRVGDATLPEEELDLFLEALNRYHPLGLHFERVGGSPVIAFEQSALYYGRLLRAGNISEAELRERLALGKKASIADSIDVINRSIDVPFFITPEAKTIHVQALDIPAMNSAARAFTQPLQPELQDLHKRLAALRAAIESGEKIDATLGNSIVERAAAIAEHLHAIRFTQPVRSREEKERRIIDLNNTHYGRHAMTMLTAVRLIFSEEDPAKAYGYLQDAEDGLNNFERYLRIIAEMKELHFIAGTHGVLDLNAYDHMPKEWEASDGLPSSLSNRYEQRIEQANRVEGLTLDALEDPSIINGLDAELAEDQTRLARELADRLTDRGSSLAVMGENLVTRTLNGDETQAHMLSVPLVDITKLGEYFKIEGFTDLFKARLHQKIAEAAHRDYADADVSVMASRILITNVPEDWIARHIPRLIEQLRAEIIQDYAPRDRREEFAAALDRLEFNRSGALLYTKEPLISYSLALPPRPLIEKIGDQFNIKDFAAQLADHLQEKFLDRIVKQKLGAKNADAIVLNGEIQLQNVTLNWLQSEIPRAIEEAKKDFVGKIENRGRQKEFSAALDDLKGQFTLTLWEPIVLDPDDAGYENHLDADKPVELPSGKDSHYFDDYDFYLSRRRQLLSRSINYWTTRHDRRRASVLTALMIQDLFQRLNERLEVVEKARGGLQLTLNRLLWKRKTPTIRNLDDHLIHRLIDRLVRSDDPEAIIELYKQLQEGREKMVPIFKYDPGRPLALPRVSHYLPRWNEPASPMIVELRAALERIRSSNRTAADLEAFKKLYREYQLTVGVALVAGTRDPRLEQVYKRDAIDEVVEADRTGAAKRFRAHLETLTERVSAAQPGSDVPPTMAHLIQNAQRLSKTMEPGFFLFKRAWGDELGFVVRDVEGDYYEAFCEVNKLNAYMAANKPDAADSTYHKILLAYLEAVRRDAGTKHPLNFLKDLDAILQRIAPEFFNPTEKVPTEKGIERMPAYKPIGVEVAMPTHALDRDGYFWILNSGTWIRDNQKQSAEALGVEPYSTQLTTARVYDPQPVLPGHFGANFDWFDKLIGFQKRNPAAIHETIDVHDLESGAVQNGTFKTGIHLYVSILRRPLEWLRTQHPDAFFKFLPNDNAPSERSALKLAA